MLHRGIDLYQCRAAARGDLWHPWTCPDGGSATHAGFIMEEASEIVVGILMLILGFTGLVMASGALDNAIFIFGLSLAAFAVLFEIGLIRSHYDRKERTARAGAGGHV